MFFKKKNDIVEIYRQFQDSDMNSYNSPEFKRGVFTFKEYKGKIFLWKVDRDVSGVLTIPDGVSVIYDGSMRGLDYITEIRMADSVQVIGSDAIDSCDNLRYIKVSAGIVYMGVPAISDCPALTEVSLPRSYKDTSLYLSIDKFYEEGFKITSY